MSDASPLPVRTLIAALASILAMPVLASGERRSTIDALPSDVPGLALPKVDVQAELAADAAAMDASRAHGGAWEKRLRVAVGNAVNASAARVGRWDTLADGTRVWRLAVTAPGATDLRFGFSRFAVPEGSELRVTHRDGTHAAGAFTLADTSPDRQLWLAPVSGDSLVLELRVPAGAVPGDDAIVLADVGAGYRNVNAVGGPQLFGAGVSGSCNVDVKCPLGDDYPDEIRSVAKYYFNSGGGTYLCTGTLVNNTRQDLTPYFLTAEHCVSTQAEATSMSLIWNYESPTCGQHGGGSTSQTQNGGATLRMHRSDTDSTLVELNSAPPEAYAVYYAGWDATGATPDGAIGIHHPSGWVKAITEDSNGVTTMNNCIGSGSSTHWRTGAPYSQGTTEGGSSGSAIFVPVGDGTLHDRLIIGTLSGGSAACNGSVPNSGYDCYGKVSIAWNGGSAGGRLKDWLDPDDTGATTLPGIDPSAPNDIIFANGFEY